MNYFAKTVPEQLKYFHIWLIITYLCSVIFLFTELIGKVSIEKVLHFIILYHFYENVKLAAIDSFLFSVL